MYPPTNDFFLQAGSDLSGLSHADLTYGALESEDGNERLAAPRSTEQWIRERLSELPPVARPFQCKLQAGDALFIPAMWPHATLTQGEGSVGLAIREGVMDALERWLDPPRHAGAAGQQDARLPGSGLRVWV